MSRVGFELMIRVFEREKTVHTLDRAATVIDFDQLLYILASLVNFSKKQQQFRLNLLLLKVSLLSDKANRTCFLWKF
jgi:hypothetical protein